MDSDDPACDWSKNSDGMRNCAYLNALIGEALNWANIWSFWFNVGVRTSKAAWSKIMGTSSVYQQCHGNYPAPLWYVNDDKLPNYNDYQVIYDWKTPT